MRFPSRDVIQSASSGSAATCSTAARSLRSISSAESDSRIPACAFTISASAQKLTPSPYGSERPWRHVVKSGSSSTDRKSSETRRDLPMPGTPTRVTSCSRLRERARLSASRRMPSSCSRPTRGACACARSTPRRERASSASHAGTGSDLPLASTELGLAVVDHVLGRAVGGLADEDAVDRRGRLQAGRGVDHVARGHPLALRRPGAERDQRLARVDGDPQLELVPLLRHPVADRERRAHRALGVVLVRGRSAEERHHRVADELLDGAAEALELPAQVRVVRGEQAADVLGIELLGAGGEADEIGEEHRHDLALLARGRGRSLQRRAARVAEPRGVRVLGRAARADDHALSVRRQRRTVLSQNKQLLTTTKLYFSLWPDHRRGTGLANGLATTPTRVADLDGCVRRGVPGPNGSLAGRGDNSVCRRDLRTEGRECGH